MTDGTDDAAAFADEAREFARRAAEDDAKIPAHERGTFVGMIHKAGWRLLRHWDGERLRSWTVRILIDVAHDLRDMGTVEVPNNREDTQAVADRIRAIEESIKRAKEAPLYSHQPWPPLPGHPRLVEARIEKRKHGDDEYRVTVGTRKLPAVDHAMWRQLNTRLGLVDEPPLTGKRTAGYSIKLDPPEDGRRVCHVFPTFTSAAAAALAYESDIEWAVGQVQRELVALNRAGVRYKFTRPRRVSEQKATTRLELDADGIGPKIKRAVERLARPRRGGKPNKAAPRGSSTEAVFELWTALGIADNVHEKAAAKCIEREIGTANVRREREARLERRRKRA